MRSSCFVYCGLLQIPSFYILGDPGAVSRVDKMFVVKVYFYFFDLTVNFHHEHFIDPTNCPWVSEDEPWLYFEWELKNALYLSVNVFSTKVLIGDTIFYVS